jgi:hypothetical protein
MDGRVLRWDLTSMDVSLHQVWLSVSWGAGGKTCSLFFYGTAAYPGRGGTPLLLLLEIPL